MKFALGMAVIKNFDDNKTLIQAFAIPGYSQSEMLINLLMQSKFTTSQPVSLLFQFGDFHCQVKVSKTLCLVDCLQSHTFPVRSQRLQRPSWFQNVLRGWASGVDTGGEGRPRSLSRFDTQAPKARLLTFETNMAANKGGCSIPTILQKNKGLNLLPFDFSFLFLHFLLSQSSSLKDQSTVL